LIIGEVYRNKMFFNILILFLILAFSAYCSTGSATYHIRSASFILLVLPSRPKMATLSAPRLTFIDPDRPQACSGARGRSRVGCYKSAHSIVISKCKATARTMVDHCLRSHFSISLTLAFKTGISSSTVSQTCLRSIPKY
jgi:hypothetical protein